MTTYPAGAMFVDEAGRAHAPFSTGTTSAPTDGTWAVGNLAVTTTGTVYACTVAGTPGTWAAVSGGGGGGFTLTRTAVKTTTYSAGAGELVPCDTTSGGFTVTLPAAPADGTIVAVKHVTQASTNAVTIARGGSDAFNKTGSTTSLTLDLLNQGVLLMYQASTAIWTVLSDSMTLTSLDSRLSAVIVAYAQPLDSDLTAIAALSTTSFGRSLLALADAAALTATNTAATTSASGIVELATTAETQTGTDTVRAVTPAGASATYPTFDEAIFESQVFS